MPVGAIAQCVTDWLQAGVPVTDCGSTKQFIVNVAKSSPNRTWFVPGHPMAGHERGGHSSCSFDLFRGRRWIVCPEFACEQALRATRTLVETVGASWTEMTPTQHDSTVALTSHVPQILASWLAAAADERFWTAVGPAFSDMTRIAGGPSTIWKDIFATNAGAISEVLGSLAVDLSAIAAELGAGKPQLDLLLELLANARAQLESPKSRLD
jgi:prephenate dehydrogenase